MEYKITREALQNDLLYDTLKALSKVMYDLQLDVYVLGALAIIALLFVVLGLFKNGV
jgi:hypothetical protein